MTQSKIFNNLSDYYMQQSQNNNTGGIMPSNPDQPDASPVPGNNTTPISQQSFAMPNSIPISATPPPYTGGTTFVPGVGNLGPDLGGYVKGAQALQDYQLNAAKNQRANEELGISKAELGVKQDFVKIAQARLGIDLNDASMKTKTFEDQQTIQQGMADAAQQGGYDGVIDYLKTADPEKAIAFHAMKLQLDNSIMQNDVMKAQLPTALDQAMLDTYKLGSRFATAIANAPADQQPAMYQQALPMLQKVLGPDIPKTYGPQAQAMGLLLTGLGSPENMLYANQGIAALTDDKMNQLNIAKQEAVKKYGAGSDVVQQIQNEITAEDAKNVQATLAVEKAKQQLSGNTPMTPYQQAQLNLSYNNALHKSSKTYIDNMETLGQVQIMAKEANDAFNKGDSNPTALAGLRYKIARLYNGPGVLNDNDLNNTLASYGLGTLSKKVKSYLSGQNEQLAPWEVKQALVLVNHIADNFQAKQEAKEKLWTDNLPPNSGIKLILPSQEYKNILSKNGLGNNTQTMSKDQIDTMYQNAITKAPDKKNQLDQLRAQLYQQNGIQ